MENERRRPRPTRASGDPEDAGNPLDNVRDELEDLLSAADDALQTLGVSPEDYLAQNRQRGGQ